MPDVNVNNRACLHFLQPRHSRLANFLIVLGIEIGGISNFLMVPQSHKGSLCFSHTFTGMPIRGLLRHMYREFKTALKCGISKEAVYRQFFGECGSAKLSIPRGEHHTRHHILITVCDRTF